MGCNSWLLFERLVQEVPPRSSLDDYGCPSFQSLAQKFIGCLWQLEGSGRFIQGNSPISSWVPKGRWSGRCSLRFNVSRSLTGGLNQHLLLHRPISLREILREGFPIELGLIEGSAGLLETVKVLLILHLNTAQWETKDPSWFPSILSMLWSVFEHYLIGICGRNIQITSKHPKNWTFE